MSAYEDDLALARGCLDDDERAWERLVRDYRPIVNRAAEGMDPGGGARDLAEELFADLYGLKSGPRRERSLLRYYQGRSSLATWLRAVLAQRYVDRLRARRRNGPSIDEAFPAPSVPSDSDSGPCRACVREALTQAIRTLSSRDRLIVACYYTQGLKLAAIGRMFGEHEATVSRHLARIRAELRTAIESALARDSRLPAAARADCLRRVMDNAGDLDLAAMLASSDGESVQNERKSSAD